MTTAALSRADLSTHGAWMVAPGDAPRVATYMALTGADASVVDASANPARTPSGMAVVAARRAFTRDRPLPPGGVLLGIEVAPGTWPGAGATQFRCDTVERHDSKGRLIVAVRVELRSSGQSGWPTLVEFALRWPNEVHADA